MALQIGTLDFPVLFVALSSWSALYFLLCAANRKHSYEWQCRIVTCIHGILITSMAAWCAFVQGPWPFTDAGGSNTPLQWLTVTMCLGYFIFDFSWCLYFRGEGAVMMVHHCLSILGLSMCLVFGRWGTELVATICGGEMTNPLLQLRWFLRETGRYDTWYGELNDIVFMVLFGIIRIGVGSALLYSYFQQPTDYLGRFGGVCIYSIGWLFFINIVQFGVNKYKKKWRAFKQRQGSVSKRADKVNGECSSVGMKGNKSSVVTKNDDNSVVKDEHKSLSLTKETKDDNLMMTDKDESFSLMQQTKDDNLMMTDKDESFSLTQQTKDDASIVTGEDNRFSLMQQSCVEGGEQIKKLVSGIFSEIPSADACLRRVVKPGVDNSNHLLNELVMSGHVSCMCSDTDDKKTL
ncbi:TLC domain-containing protein 5-like [Gigantopelta aegis]|uniref:TLC domain-containing protein 5-like n=1 Tax=Gigantopelta aegis TaxID=1735272 RepID=UPI001B889BB8|nr:TLC domain-containing protein 5-like [Gigantopelta aegis]XP_041373450.1 TLC domain-containing protein 5-like [Gigantopelta aegis]